MDEERWEAKRERWEARRRDRRSRHNNPAGQAFAGIMLVAIGLIFLLSNMGYVSAGYIFRNFWPVILILIGARMLVFDRGPEGFQGPRGVGVVWLIIGSLFLLSNLNFINVAFRTIWPFFPMAIGAFILWKVFIDRGDDGLPGREDVVDEAPGQPDSDSRVRAHAAMGHVSRRSSSQEFRGGNLSTFMGMCELDLRDASPAASGAVIDVSAFMGGIEIRVPTDWTIDNRVTAFLGGVEDKTRASSGGSKTLVLRGSVFMGGLELRH